jgi:hypothetical protein
MNRKNTPRIVLTFLLALAMAVPFLTMSRNASAMSTNNFFGAIYTSTNDGTTVNQNLYDSKSDVYLNGGPQNENGNGIPNGTYYFQVTDPSGATLLSTDLATCRQLTVSGGVVAGAAGPCPHLNGTFNPNNGSMPVQLIPFNTTPNNGGEYKVWLIRQTSTTTIAQDGIHINFKSADSKTDNFKVEPEECQDCPPPPPQANLSGLKFYDADADGQLDPNEVGIPDVRIDVYVNDSFFVTVTTDPAGAWTVTVPSGSTYTVREQLPNVVCPTNPAQTYWVQTAPAADGDGDRSYNGTANQDVNGLNFGNICFHPASGGFTLGFWSNKNGQAIMKAGDNFASALAFLNALPLKDFNGTNKEFDPNNYSQFRTWLLNGNAVNMAYMLSVQLSATSLDVRYGFLSDSQLVDASSLGLGIISIGSIRTAAIAELNGCGDPCLTFSGNPLRDDQELLKTALDRINNNLLPFASADACTVCYPEVVQP